MASMMTLSPSTLSPTMSSSDNHMSIIKIHGWFGGYTCKVCGSVAPYGICPTCNNSNK